MSSRWSNNNGDTRNRKSQRRFLDALPLDKRQAGRLDNLSFAAERTQADTKDKSDCSSATSFGIQGFSFGSKNTCSTMHDSSWTSRSDAIGKAADAVKGLDGMAKVIIILQIGRLVEMQLV
jgi:hypothetical protein